MDEKIRLIKNTGLIALGNFSAKMVSFLLLPLYTSILSTAEYGTYDYIVTISTFLLPIVTLSMTEAMFRFIIDTGNEGIDFKRVVSNAFFVILAGITVSGCIFIILELAASLNYLLYIWLYLTASSMYSFSNNLLRGLGRMKEYAIISSAKNILTVLLNVISIVVLKMGMYGLLISLCFSEILAFVVVAVISRLHKQISISLISKSTIKELLTYSLPLIPNTLGATIINLSDRLIISNVMGPSANGIYSVSYKFPNVVETVYHYFYTAWSESASRVFRKGKDAAVKYYQSLFEEINNFVFSLILIMTAAMPIMFRIFVRGNYIEGFDYVPLLMFAMYFNCIAMFFSGIYTAYKKTKLIAVSTIIAAVVNIVLNITLVNHIGLYGAAVATLLAELLLVVIRKILIRDEIDFQIKGKKTIIEIVIALLIVFLYDFNNWSKICISIFISGLYAITVNKKLLLTLIKFLKKA